MLKLYKVNEALGTYQLLEAFEPAAESSVRTKVTTSRLENLRGFVRFEIHRPNGEREVIARGMGGPR